MAKQNENRVYLHPLKSALPCTICKHDDKRLDRTCAGCLLGKSKFERKTDRQLALMGLLAGEGGVIYGELGSDIV